MASWVGTAKTLVGDEGQVEGTLMFIAQPAEEIGAGAKAMLADGLFTRFPKPDYALCAARRPNPYGTIGYRSGVGTSRRPRDRVPGPWRSRLGAGPGN